MGEADRNTGAGGVLGAGRAAEARRAGREGRGTGAGGTLGATGVSGTVEDGDTGRSVRPEVGRKPAQWANRHRRPNQRFRTFGITGVAVVMSGGTKIPVRAGGTAVALGGVSLVVVGRVRRTCVGIMLTVFCSLLLVREVRSGP